MNIVRYRNGAVVAVVAAYLLLNYGFQVVKIPPGRYGVPVGELCLVAAFLLCSHRFVLPMFVSTGVVWAFGAWWLIGGMQLIRAIPEYGFWAFRDASQLIESGFLYLGFSLSMSEIARLKRWTPWFLMIAIIYGLTYPLRELFQKLSPVLQTSSGGEAFLFFRYDSTPTLLILASFLLILHAGKTLSSERWILVVLASVLLTYTVYAFQQRTIYLQIITLVMLSAGLNARIRRLLPVIGVFFIVALAVFPLLGVDLQGRLGMDASLDFIGRHLLAIAGISSEGLEHSAYGVGERLAWWYKIYLSVSATWFTGLLGLGYGEPLIEFLMPGGIVVREPHNSVMTEFGRLGILGLASWLIAQAYLAAIWLSAYRYALRRAHQTTLTFLMIVLFYAALVWVFSLGEDAFEKPFKSIPYYFFWGCVLKIRFTQTLAERASTSALPGNRNDATRAATVSATK